MRTTCTDISVIICAYTLDRWSDLVAAVGSVERQTLPPEQLLVVIDHNDALLERAKESFPHAQVVAAEDPKGLSGARNTALGLATGELVAFLDDDAVACERWLEELCAEYSAADHVLGVGGFIAPLWEKEPPGWYPEEFYWVVGCTYRGMPEGTRVRNLIGANMSFRRNVLVAVGGFSSGLGRTSANALGDEETGACIRASKLYPDGVFIYASRARVEHRVPAARTTWHYYRKRCYGEGISKAQLSREVGSRDGLASERRHALVTLPMGALRAFGALFRGDWSGPARACAIVGGLAITGTGYVAGRLAGGGRTDEAPALDSALDAAPAVVAAPPPRLRLLMVTPRYFPLVGGVEHHVAQVARLLARDVDVTVLTTDTTGELPPSEVVDGVAVERVRAWPRDKDYYFAPRAYRTIVRGGWDLVHVQSYHTAVAPIAMLAALRARIPYVLTFHGGGHSSRTRNTLRGTQWRMLRPLLARARKLIAVADFEAERFSTALDLPRDRFVVIPNGSDLPPISTEEAARLRAGRQIIVSVGRLEQYKGHQRVIEAMPAVLQRLPDCKLHILGSGPYGPQLEALVSDLRLDSSVTIRAIPPTERLQMAQEFAAGSLIVLMSEFETHPLAVIEALALGCPALVADTSGLSELAQRGLARAIRLDATAPELAAAIVEELINPRPVPAVAAPTWQECAARLLKLYETVLARGHSGAPVAAAPAREREA